MLRFAVERAFTILGEAFAQLRREFPAVAMPVPGLSEAAGLRNIIIHGYAEIDDATVWHTATVDLPQLIEVLEPLLDAP